MINFESVIYKNMSNITNEAISFEIERNKINLISSINFNLLDNVYKSIIGINNIKEGEIFVNEVNLYKNNISDIFNIVKNNIFFIENNFFVEEKTVYENIINISYLLNVYDKVIFNKLTYDLKINEFFNKKIFEINIDEYILIVLFFIKLSGTNTILIKDFFQFISNEEDKKKFISTLNQEINLTNKTLILLSSDLKINDKSIIHIDLNKNSKYTKYSEYIKISENNNSYMKSNKNYFINFFKFYLKRNWISWIILMLFNFLSFTSIIFLFSFSSYKINISMWYFILISLSIIQISINIYMLYHFYNRNKNFIRHSMIFFNVFFFSIISISLLMFGAQLFGIILSILPIFLVAYLQNEYFVSNSAFISLLLINIVTIIAFSEILIFTSIRNLFNKDEIKL